MNFLNTEFFFFLKECIKTLGKNEAQLVSAAFPRVEGKEKLGEESWNVLEDWTEPDFGEKGTDIILVSDSYLSQSRKKQKISNNK